MAAVGYNIGFPEHEPLHVVPCHPRITWADNSYSLVTVGDVDGVYSADASHV